MSESQNGGDFCLFDCLLYTPWAQLRRGDLRPIIIITIIIIIIIVFVNVVIIIINSSLCSPPQTLLPTKSTTKWQRFTGLLCNQKIKSYGTGWLLPLRLPGRHLVDTR